MKHITQYKLLKPFPNHQVGDIVVKDYYNGSNWRFKNTKASINNGYLEDTEFFKPIYEEFKDEDYYYIVAGSICVLTKTGKNLYYEVICDQKKQCGGMCEGVLYRTENPDFKPSRIIPKTEVLHKYYYINLDKSEPVEAFPLKRAQYLIDYLHRKVIGNVFAKKEDVDISKVLWGKHIVGNNGGLYYNPYINDIKQE